MKRDPHSEGANPFAARERHSVSVTRMCLRTGSVQLPFALVDRLPEGEVLAVDTEKGEAMVLWSTPPRTLQGLAPLFAAHEIQVNDQLLLEPRDEELRVTVQKRPRRSRPKVQASTWRSVHEDAPRRERQQGAEDAGDAATDASDGSAGASEPATGRPGDGAREATPLVEERGEAAQEGPPPARDPAREVGPRLDVEAEDVEARPPRVERRGSQRRRATPPREGGTGWFGDVMRRARGLFGGGEEPEEEMHQPRRAPGAPEPDAWASAWNDPREEDPIAPRWNAEVAPARPDPGPEPGAPARARDLDPPPDASPARPARDEGPSEEEPLRLRFGPRAPENEAGAANDPHGRADVPPEAPGEGEAEARPREAAPVTERASEFPAAEPPTPEPPAEEASPPSRAEKFLGGDLRTRLLRYLAGPDAPVIAGFESLAERFDLEPEMALELLDDIARDPPPGVRLTRIREGTYRLERERN